MTAGYVYILKNRSHRALKIGSTRKAPRERAAELSTTGTLHPFQVVHSVQVDDCRTVERKIHKKLAGKRVSKKREFFSVNAEEAIAALDDIAREDKSTRLRETLSPEMRKRIEKDIAFRNKHSW